MGAERDYAEELSRRTSKCRPAHPPSAKDGSIIIANEGTPGSLLGIGTDRRAKLGAREKSAAREDHRQIDIRRTQC